MYKMAKKKDAKEKKQNSNIDKELSILDKAAKSIFSVIDNNYNDKVILSTKDQKIRSILDRELELSKGVSQGSIIDFVASVKTENNIKSLNRKQSGLSPNSNELFTQNINDIFGYFQDMYRNRFLEISDLKFIAKFIPSLGEAVKTILDSVVSSDNIAETINRTIDLPSSISKDKHDAIVSEIKRSEKELKLLNKLKNIAFKNTLVTGQYYVYCVSYNKIFEEYDKIKKNEKSVNVSNTKTQFGNSSLSKKATESFILGDVNITDAMESVKTLLSSSQSIDESQSKLNNTQINSIMKECHDSMPIITCEQSSVHYEALDYVSDLTNSDIIMEAFSKKKSKKQNETDMLNHDVLQLHSPDGVKSIDRVKPSKFDIPGVYIKYIDAKNIIPLKVFDQIIGYYLIHPKVKKNKNSAGLTSGVNSIGTTLFSTINISEQKKHDAIEKIVDSIAEGILQNFDNKFVSKNMEYKKVIADCIISNGLTDKDYNIQFIPADDIIPFTINENEEGFGESVLTDSLFPAKLLLSMLVCRLLNYINKTGNKTIAHIHKGPVNSYTTNQVNRVIRDLQEQNVTFNDLLSPNLVFNKFNRDGNIALPTAKNGDRLVEFETQEGQNIDMSPEFEKELEKMAIIGTGVPSTIMEYTDSVDFAKQIVSANIKFAGRIATIQSDLEESLTELYKKICLHSNLSDECKSICVQSLEIKLPRPRVITNGNNNDYIRNIVETAEAIVDVALGRETITNAEIEKNGVQIKEKAMFDIVKKNSPFIQWESIEETIENIKAKYTFKPEDDNAQNDDGGGNSF